MALPFFYVEQFKPGETGIDLDENNSRHIIQVLRMKTGDSIHLTDGKGHLVLAEIVKQNKKLCAIEIKQTRFLNAPVNQITIAISLLKNPGRFEWFLEKCTEIGVTAIQPMICTHTEKSGFRAERFEGILISAMLQSQQVWLPRLKPLQSFNQVLEETRDEQKFIAHCTEDSKKELMDCLMEKKGSRMILIGPEGDFSTAEIKLASSAYFIPVSLGKNRLRTETAGMVAATLLKFG